MSTLRVIFSATILFVAVLSVFAGVNERISVASDGALGNKMSYNAAISADGRYVAFWSAASNLVLDDTNDTGDIFVRDRQTGTTERVSVASDGTQGNANCGPTIKIINIDDNFAVGSFPVISADGRYVAFMSYASNLVPGDTNQVRDVFLRDRQTGTTERVSVAGDGTQGNDSSGGPAISADGRYVAFNSAASNLVPDDTNEHVDVFVHDRQTGAIERVSVACDGVQGNLNSMASAISADGRYVAFNSTASNLVPGDTNDWVGEGGGHYGWDVFVHDRQTGVTERVSIASDGTQGDGYSWWNLAISADGRFVAFMSAATNMVPGDTNGVTDIFVRDRQTGVTERVSVASDGTQGNSGSQYPAISADGRYVVFVGPASNLVPGDTNRGYDVFIRDRQTGTTERVSVASDGTQVNNYSEIAVISADGRYVVIESAAGNLVPGDTNGVRHVFVRDLGGY